MKLLLIPFLFFFGVGSSVAESYVPFEENGKVGLKNEAGQVIIPATYDALGWSNGMFSVSGQVTGYKLNGSWGVVNLKNERITPPDYFSLTPSEGRLLIASKQSASLTIRTGCISTAGETIIPFTYTDVKVHSLRAVACIRDGNQFKHGLLDLENKIIIPFLYRSIVPMGSLRYAVEDFNGKKALFSEGGKQITGFTIDSLSQFTNNLAIIYENGKQGLITREGQLRSEAKYRDIKIEPNRVQARLPNEWQVLDASNRQTEIIAADSIVNLQDERYALYNAGVAKLVNADLKKVAEQSFAVITPFQNGLSVFKHNELYGVIRKNGTILLPPKYEVVVLHENYVLTLENKSGQPAWLLRDTTGRQKNMRTYDAINPPHDNLFPVLKKGYWGAVDGNGQEVVACVYDSVLEIKDNQLAVKFKGLYGIINSNEEWLVFPQPHRVTLLNQDRYFKKSGNTILLCSYTGTVLYFTPNPIDVKENYFIESISTGGTWTIDFDGRIVTRQLPPADVTEKIFPATEGLRGIQKNGKFGFIDDEGRLRIANRYEDIKPFSEGLAAVKIRNKWGFINRDEKIVIQPAYEDALPFQHGFSIIQQNKLYGLISDEGVLLLPARYQDIEVLNTGKLLLTQNQLTGLADAQGNVLLQPKYHSVQDLNNGYAIVEQDGKYGLVTLQGLSTIPQVYDKLVYDRAHNRYFALKESGWVTLN